MQEILFRGKMTRNEEWVEGYYVRMYDGRSTIENDMELCSVRPETVGRFIGRSDKKGKRIFEGDIVKTKYGRLCIVCWKSTPCFAGWDLDVVDTYENIRYAAPDGYDLWGEENLEVIGNIHDNPELLKKEN